MFLVEAVFEIPHCYGHLVSAVFDGVSAEVPYELVEATSSPSEGSIDVRPECSIPCVTILTTRFDEFVDIEELGLPERLALSGQPEEIIDEILHTIKRVKNMV